MSTFQPVIKWSGSKRSQAENIVSFFPREIDTYYEPFCGGCSVLRAIFETDIKAKKYVCSDINIVLIGLWLLIKSNPKLVLTEYTKLWEELNSFDDVAKQKEFYEKIRERYNKKKSPLDFMFLDRTCFNGLIRYNSDGDFNSPFHLNRGGINPSRFEKIIYEWSELINKNDVQFKVMTYRWVRPEKGDFFYLDPPYANTKGMYGGLFNNEKFFKWLGELPCKWALSYDGKSGDEDKTFDVPTHLYDEHYYLGSGNSSFKRITQTDKNANVYESLYLKL